MSDSDLRTATEAARRAGALLRDSRPDRTDTKSSFADLVTECDIAAGVEVVRAILASEPSGRFVVEEPEVYELTGCTEGSLDDDRVWVIDPIDGTTSFVHGYPTFSVSVALLEDGMPAVGVVLNVPLDEVFAAASGQGATLNGRPVSVSDAADLEHSLLVTGFPYDRGEPFERQMAAFAHLTRIAHDVRRDGSAAVDCCHVACGRCDGFWEYSLRPWDTSAGMLIAREAGAAISSIDGSPWTPATPDVLATAPRIHALLLEALAGAPRDVSP